MLSTLLLATSLWQAAATAGDRLVVCLPEVTVPGCVNGQVVPFEPAPVFDAFGDDLWWIIMSHAGDLFTTAIALERCNGACGEGNKAGFNAEARMALKVAGTTSAAAMVWKLRSAGKHREAAFVRWGTVLFNSGLMFNNGWHAWKKR